MKRKIRITDNISGKVIEREVTVRNYDHLLAQINNRHKVFKDKTKYTRKVKHKGKNIDSFL